MLRLACQTRLTACRFARGSTVSRQQKPKPEPEPKRFNPWALEDHIDIMMELDKEKPKEMTLKDLLKGTNRGCNVNFKY